MSVVFIDLARFSTITHGLDPEEVRDLADEVLTAVAGVIEDFDGYVDAFRGDGLIALFGAPRSHPDDPLRAVLAAAKSLETISEVGRGRGIELAGRAGVNSGIVIAGAVSSGRAHSYTVMGSPVNLAARLEEAAEPGEVWVGPETYESTRHRLL
ncbi:MAG TPA: adenylate/guanylate cyclase domain-containing protein, partial [Trueperaceae bacterium]|nr:adenylate/guanylate cyclase domain-containing protein [Trueperaceae bacterium]